MLELQLVEKLIDNLSKSKILFFDRNLSVFLREIAKNETLMNALKECNKGVDFSAESSAFLLKGALPVENSAIVSLIIGLLVKVDRGEITSSQMFSAVAPSAESPEIAYAIFIERCLTPLKDAFCAVLRGEAEEVAPPKKTGHYKLHEEVIDWLNHMEEKLSVNPSLDEKKLKEIFYMTDGFKSSLDSLPLSVQRLIFLGLKNTLVKYRLFCKEIVAIEQLFADYGVSIDQE